MRYALDPMLDYSQFLHVAEGRQIWWSLLTAVRLGAGYVPNPTDSTALVAGSNRIKSNERTLLAAVRVQVDGIPPPALLVRDGEAFVAAMAFLVWLAKYILDTKSAIEFPAELARVVSNVETEARGGRHYVPLSDKLEPYYEANFADLPSSLQVATTEAVRPLTWDDFGPTRRRRLIKEFELNHDPAREAERQFWCLQYLVKKQNLEKAIATWEAISAASATELADKERRLEALTRELAEHAKKLASARQAQGSGPHNMSPWGPTKRVGHLNHDSAMQARANQIAAERMGASNRSITRSRVAKFLATEIGMNEATVVRRIRKEW